MILILTFDLRGDSRLVFLSICRDWPKITHHVAHLSEYRMNVKI